MKQLKWWLLIVGVLYLLEGGGLTLMALTAPDKFAALWASAPEGSLDEIAVRGMRIAGLPGVLTWVLLGVMMLFFSRRPGRASTLVITVAAWELLVWLPSDLVASLNGFEGPRAAALMAVHIVIGVSGILLLRRALNVSRGVAAADPRAETAVPTAVP
jgi:hypothetical protein